MLILYMICCNALFFSIMFFNELFVIKIIAYEPSRHTIIYWFLFTFLRVNVTLVLDIIVSEGISCNSVQTCHKWDLNNLLDNKG